MLYLARSYYFGSSINDITILVAMGLNDLCDCTTVPKLLLPLNVELERVKKVNSSVTSFMDYL